MGIILPHNEQEHGEETYQNGENGEKAGELSHGYDEHGWQLHNHHTTHTT